MPPLGVTWKVAARAKGPVPKKARIAKAKMDRFIFQPLYWPRLDLESPTNLPAARNRGIKRQNREDGLPVPAPKAQPLFTSMLEGDWDPPPVSSRQEAAPEQSGSSQSTWVSPSSSAPLPQFSELPAGGVGDWQAAEPEQSGSLQSMLVSPSSSTLLVQFSGPGGGGVVFREGVGPAEV